MKKFRSYVCAVYGLYNCFSGFSRCVDGMTCSIEMNGYLKAWKCRPRSKQLSARVASSTLTWDLFTPTTVPLSNIGLHNEIRAADGSVFVDIVARIGGRESYASLRVSRTMPVRQPRGDRGVVQEFGLHSITRWCTRKHHKTVSIRKTKQICHCLTLYSERTNRTNANCVSEYFEIL